ncbi:hypothetical protein QPL79_00060 [Ignisphaera sp. 4213-co]|uniref:Transcription factor E n=1 Tax=Ignisphaera cupida TaxID=3050454 RepID=A0ABD4Z4T5_9CREN|nr:hypothetical protein [Ignisphaera sp. 4213-co]MDK6027769.1 hypothetical protein [Ignisphaera sp. 4213-co]
MRDSELLKIIEQMYGASGRKVLETLLNSSSGKTIDEIAQETGIRVNDVRRLLYEMSSGGFVAYIRSQRGESHWYNYRWFSNYSMIKAAISRRIKDVIRVLHERLNYESNNTFYICPNDFSIYTFDEAFENNFQCIHCGSDLVEFNNKLITSYLTNVLEKLRKINNNHLADLNNEA